MSNSKMLIDASHPEETRVVVLKGNRIEEFDFEAADRKQLRGNIYLAKVTRVEPSLQAAFIEYGGNRHGFLAFSEIHPDYYQIPFADRQVLLEEEARAHRDEDDEGRGAESRAVGGEGRNGGGEGRRSGGERNARGGGGGGRDRSERGGRSERTDRGEGRERGERGQRRSRRHRRDGAATPLERRDASDESISELLPEGVEADVAPGDEPETSHRDAEAYSDVVAGHSGDEAEGTPLDAARADHDSVRVRSPEAEPDAEQTHAGDRDADPTAGAALLPDHAGDDVDHAVAPEAEHPSATPSLGEDVTPHDPEAMSDDAIPRADAGTADVAFDARSDDRPAAEAGAADEVEARGIDGEGDSHEAEHEEEHVEQIGGDALSDVAPRPTRLRRHYKIQEVIKRRQILLIQVVKEERGNKGAALTTYLSLAGRYSVLMPNTAKGGGISRKITDGDDRKRLKAIAGELDVPEGMGVILRTAGAARSPIEVRRDFEYLLRMWESVRELTLKSTAPTLVYEEGSLIKRSIRDLFSKEVEEIVVAGEAGFAEARDFMRMLMPGNVKSVQIYRDPQPIFAKSGVEAQLDAMFSPHVTLKSGGYLVINQTEALVAIDVNSGRSTREHNIEDTALRTNMEAAEEVARQLRLRDLAGLIVVDFIDMEEGRNNRAVERRIKEALKNDRARIQIGRISHFGLLEMSRQRIRTGVLEGSTVACPHCAGAGTVRSTASIALHVLRLLEDALLKDASHDLVVRTRAEVALYVLNQKRAKLVELEQRFGVTLAVAVDPLLTGMIYHAIDRGDLATPAVAPAPRLDRVRVDSIAPIFEPGSEIDDEVDAIEPGEDAGGEPEAEHAEGGPADAADGNRRRKRRRRRRGRDRDGAGEGSIDAAPLDDEPGVAEDQPPMAAIEGAVDLDGEPMPTMSGEAFAEAALSVEAIPPAETVVVELAAVASEAAAEPAVTEEAPRRRRSRRAATAAEPVDAAPEEASPAPRRRRASRARAVQPEGAPVLADEAALSPSGPSADRDVGADSEAWERHESLSTLEASSAPAAEADASSEPPAASSPEAAPAVEPVPSAPPDPDRPKRSGWWQRAKMSFGS